jgi:hypothetical protein
MRPQRLFTAIAAAVLFSSAVACAEPIDFAEVSLLVRARESEQSIIHEVRERKLVRPLTPQQENTLKAQGATESLLQALRTPAVALAQTDAAAWEERRTKARTAQPQGSTTARATSTATASPTQQNGVYVFDVSPGHPVNLSQWGGPHYEFAFHAPRRLDDGSDHAVLVNQAASWTHTATYLAVDAGENWVPDRRHYSSTMAHTFTRGLRIDRRNPVVMEGVPYTLYPVYAAGGVSLYYIGATSDSVKLAVSTSSSM